MYFNMFIIAGTTYALLLGLLTLVSTGPAFNIITVLQAGIFFGAFMSMVCVTAHLLAIVLRRYPVSAETLGVAHARQIKITMPYSDTYNACLSSIRAIRGGHIVLADRDRGYIKARIPVNLLSFGEEIQLNIHDDDDGASQVDIYGHPVIRWTLLDYGKNLENVEKICGFLHGRNKVPTSQIYG
jgi:hypothetical protein